MELLLAKCWQGAATYQHNSRALRTRQPLLFPHKTLVPLLTSSCPQLKHEKFFVLLSFFFFVQQYNAKFFFLMGFLSHLNGCLIQFCSCQVFVYFLISLTAKILLFTDIFPGKILFSGSRRIPLRSIDADIECQLSLCVRRHFSPVLYNLLFISVSSKLHSQFLLQLFPEASSPAGPSLLDAVPASLHTDPFTSVVWHLTTYS